MNKVIARLCGMVGAVVLATAAFAFYDTQILIDRALNSPTLTVRYSGARAAMVELRLNGVSLGTRTVSTAKTSGETNFTLDLRSLGEGDNEVEVRIYDKSGKLLGSQKSVISNDDGTSAPVRMTYPKMGATVQGAVDIKVGFGKEMKSAYVSFFIDDQFKAMTNTFPYSFTWDTTRDSNGWHELEALLVDETSTTFKTRKVRVLVNNPGGRTDRPLPVISGATIATTSLTPVPKRMTPKTTTTAPVITNTVANAVTPQIAAIVAANVVQGIPGERAGLKPGTIASTQTAGPRVLTPNISSASKTTTAAPKTAKVSIKQSAAPKLNFSTNAITSAATATGMLSITKGQRLPDVGTLTIVLNKKIIDFDVAPRIKDGIAIAPIRHLIESNGGEVSWENAQKIVNALAEGKTIRLKIGDKFASVDGKSIELELAPFIEKNRAIIPLSFVRDALEVDVQFDPATGHVLITSRKKN